MLPFLRVLDPFHADFGLFVFVVMISVAGTGLLAAHIARGRYRRTTLDDLRDGLSPFSSREDFEDLLRRRTDVFAEAVPTLLVTIGLLGTFLGLAVSIDTASVMLRSGSSDAIGSEQLGRLSLLLGGIGLKFKSSAWGLLASMLIRPPMYQWVTLTRRREAERLVHERSKELEDARAADTNRRHGELMVAYSTLLDQMTHSIAHLGQQTIAVTKEVCEQSSRSNTQLAAIGESLTNLNKTLLTIPESIDSLRQAGASLTAGAKNFQEGTRKSLEGLATTMTQMDTGQKEAMREISKVSSDASRSIANATREMSQNLEAKLGQAVKSLTEQSTQSSNVLLHHTNDTKIAISAALASMTSTVEKQYSATQDLNALVEEMQKQTSSMKNTFAEISNSLKSAMSQIARTQPEKQIETLLTIRSRLDQVVQSVTPRPEPHPVPSPSKPLPDQP